MPLNLVISGLEDFENKIDKIASGTDNDENSWINKLYNKYNETSEDNFELSNDMEGLEPPMLDETWGLKDGEEKNETNKREKRENVSDEDFNKELERKCI